ncbi:MAG: YncE family protein [Microthrixaceae bacterium]
MTPTRTTLAVAACAAVFAAIGTGCVGADDVTVRPATSATGPSRAGSDGHRAKSAGAANPATTTTSTTAPDRVPTDRRTLALKATLTEGDLSPKSIVASADGLFFAQNMIYSHNVAVFDRSLKLVKTIPDSVDLAAFGIDGHPGISKGGPVEMAFTHDGDHAYVSQYQMYGKGFTRPGDDKCAKQTPSGPTAWDDSYLYRIDTHSLTIDQVIEVGPVPKYVAVTPDDRTVLVSNWCGYDVSVVDTATGRQTRRVPIGRYPRGIVVSPDSKTAYVAVMGSSDIAVVDLGTFEVDWIRGIGRGPRHLVLSPDGSALYATLNRAGQVVRIDTKTRTVTGRVASAGEPRSMAISHDGASLYVVNYDAGALSKVRTSDMTQLQRLPTNHHPIGVTYDPVDHRAWVACYGGTIQVFDDKAS